VATGRGELMEVVTGRGDEGASGGPVGEDMREKKRKKIEKEEKKTSFEGQR